jgi:hypothetical protein
MYVLLKVIPSKAPTSTKTPFLLAGEQLLDDPLILAGLTAVSF